MVLHLPDNWPNSNLKNVGFWREEKTEGPGEKPLGAKERTNNKLSAHVHAGIWTSQVRLVGGKYSHHYATLAHILSWSNHSWWENLQRGPNHSVYNGQIVQFLQVRYNCSLIAALSTSGYIQIWDLFQI